VGALQLDVGLGQRLMLVDEGEVQLPAGQPRDQPLAVVVEHGQVDVGVALVEAGHGAGDQGLDGGGEAGQPQPTPPQAGELAELLLGLVQVGEHRLGMRHQRPAGVGQAHRSHATLDEPGARLPLEGGDLLADRRLRERQRRGRGRERAAAGDLPQHPEPTRIEH